MKRILISVVTSGAVLATAIIATNSFFSDVETSTGNFFSAGTLDLKIDSTAHYAGMVCTNNVWVEEVTGSSTRTDLLGDACTGSWSLKDLDQEKFFSFTDVKPGDEGENTISIHPYNNDAWACIDITNMQNAENTRLEAETAAGDLTDVVGELAQNIYFFAWNDTNGDNIWNGSEVKLFTNTMGPASDVLNNKTYTLADGGTGTPLPGGVTSYIGLKWCAGTMVVNEADKLVTCNGASMGNQSQSDSVTADVAFRIEQSRNNPGFRCENHKLVLENETINPAGPWVPITNDQTRGELSWVGDGPTFNYSLTATGLALNTDYNLIYYADPYPGNNPGAFIGTATSDGSGNLVMAGNPDLNTDLPELPDANNAIGAKIWLVLKSDYNSGTAATGPMTAWQPEKYLFEGNVYIHYDDTNHP